MRALPAESTTQLGAFTTAQALASGWSAAGLRQATTVGELVRLRHGVYAVAAPGRCSRADRLRLETVAALLAVPMAVASHLGAAALAGLPLLPSRSSSSSSGSSASSASGPSASFASGPSASFASGPGSGSGSGSGSDSRSGFAVCLTVAPQASSRATSIHLHRATLIGPDLASATGEAGVLTRRTAGARTVCDVAREFGVEAAVVAGDAALRDGLTNSAELQACLHRCAGWNGIHRAVRAVALTDGRAESPLESLSRLRLAHHGIPTPELQRVVRDASGRPIGRVDFWWPYFGVVGEADGRGKYEGRYTAESHLTATGQALYDEKLRQEQLEEAGLIVVRWGWPDLRNFATVADRLRAAFARSGRR